MTYPLYLLHNIVGAGTCELSLREESILGGPRPQCDWHDWIEFGGLHRIRTRSQDCIGKPFHVDRKLCCNAAPAIYVPFRRGQRVGSSTPIAEAEELLSLRTIVVAHYVYGKHVLRCAPSTPYDLIPRL